MQSRLRLLIIVAFIVILLGVVAAFVLPGLGGDDSPATTSPGTSGQQGVVQQPTAGPTSTPQPTLRERGTFFVSQPLGLCIVNGDNWNLGVL